MKLSSLTGYNFKTSPDTAICLFILQQTSCFVFGTSQVQISSRRPKIVTEIFSDFSQSLQANAAIVP
jgi:hypothetical protein